MLNANLDLAIRKYFVDKNYVESLKCMNDKNEIERDSFTNLTEIFRISYDKDSEPKKLSFGYKTSNSQSLLKRKLSRMNETVLTKNNSKKVNKKKMPESFLLLMNELCVDKEIARKMFENPTDWSYVKSDRKIFCTAKGKSHLKIKDDEELENLKVVF